jgi:hypothetical protein
MAKKAAAKKTAPPRNRIAGSMADQIDRLEVNRSVSVATRFAVNVAMDPAAILDELKGLRSGLAAYVARVTDDLDTREYKVEGGTFLTDDKSAFICTAAVTRIS